MSFTIFRPSRRAFLGAIALGSAAYTVRGAFADELAQTPRIQEGPKIHRNHKPVLTTECFVKGYANNAKDNIFRRATATEAGKKLAVDFVPVKDSRIGELAATFDIVLGATPQT